jgi:hypothetical protein
MRLVDGRLTRDAQFRPTLGARRKNIITPETISGSTSPGTRRWRFPLRLQPSHEPDPANPPSAPQLFTSAITSPATLLRQHLRHDGEERPVGRVHRAARNDQRRNTPARSCARLSRSCKTAPTPESMRKRPNEQLAILDAIGKSCDDEHQHHGQKKWRRAEQANLLNAACRSGANHRRNPDHQAVHAEAPAEVLEAQHQHARHAQRRAKIRVAGAGKTAPAQAPRPDVRCSLLAAMEPPAACLAPQHPDKGPQHRRNAFENKRHLPADCSDQVSGAAAIHVTVTGLPRIRIALARERSAAREPVGQQNQHRRKDEALRNAQQQPIHDQQPVVVDDPGESGKNSPADQREKDEPRRALADGVGCRGYLKEKIAEKERPSREMPRAIR